MTFQGFGPNGHIFSPINERVRCWHCDTEVRTEVEQHYSSDGNAALAVFLAGDLYLRKLVTHQCPNCKMILGFFDSKGKYSETQFDRLMPMHKLEKLTQPPPYEP